jgi:hypothetical protein
MITRRLRLGEGERPSGRSKWLGWLEEEAGSRADPAGNDPVPADERPCISGLERRRRRSARGVDGPVDRWDAAERYSDDWEAGLATEVEAVFTGKGGSGWSEVIKG